MRKFQSLAITCLICISMALPVSAASLDSQLSALQADLNDTVEKTTKGLLGSRYTVGSIYITSANVDEEEVADMMGGEWIEIN